MSNDTVTSAASTPPVTDTSKPQEPTQPEGGLTAEQQATFVERYKNSIKDEPGYRGHS